MILENQVCSLSLAKKLKALGVKKESLFLHVTFKNKSSTIPETELNEIIWYSDLEEEVEKNYLEDMNFYSAFTVAELIDMLPNLPQPFRLSFGIENPDIDLGGKYYCTTNRISYPDDHDFYSDNLANCLAEMIILLIKNGIIKNE